MYWNGFHRTTPDGFFVPEMIDPIEYRMMSRRMDVADIVYPNIASYEVVVASLVVVVVFEKFDCVVVVVLLPVDVVDVIGIDDYYVVVVVNHFEFPMENVVMLISSRRVERVTYIVSSVLQDESCLSAVAQPV
jgi:hypothetical protein